METTGRNGAACARFVAYADDRTIEFPDVAATDAATAAAVAEEVARSAGAVGKFDEDEAFFAFLDACASRGVEFPDWTPKTTKRPNSGFVPLAEGFAPFRVDGAVTLLNASAKPLAVECENVDGELEGYMFEPGATATIVDGHVTGATPVAKERLADGFRHVPLPYCYSFDWRDPKTTETGSTQIVRFATAKTRIAENGGFVKTARVHGKKDEDGVSSVTYYCRDGKFYQERGGARGAFRICVEDVAGSTNEKREAAFAAAAEAAAAAGYALETEDADRSPAAAYEKMRRETARTEMLDRFVEADGRSWIETGTPTYVVSAQLGPYACVSIVETETRPEDIECWRAATKSDQRLLCYPLSEREEAIAKAFELAEEFGTELDVGDLAEAEIFDAELASTAPWREYRKTTGDFWLTKNWKAEIPRVRVPADVAAGTEGR